MSKAHSRKTIFSSVWCSFCEIVADTGDGKGEQPYYAIDSSDYVGVIAKTKDGLFPLIHQVRPVAGITTCELPAGTVDEGETPEEAMRRELKEETGLDVEKIVKLGTHCSDSGRLTNRIHSFYAETSKSKPNFKTEPGLRVEYVTEKELMKRATTGKFHQLLHVGTVGLWLIKRGQSTFEY